MVIVGITGFWSGQIFGDWQYNFLSFFLFFKLKMKADEVLTEWCHDAILNIE